MSGAWSRGLAQLGAAAITVLGVTLLAFLALRLAPGDPVELMLGESASAADRHALRAKLGVDQPVAAQLVRFAGGVARGDLGESLSRKKPVSGLIARSLPNTLVLALASLALACALGIPLGLYCAYRRGSLAARAAYGASVVLGSFPSFWLGPLLIILLALRWPWLPVSSFDSWAGLVLPALTMAAGLAAHLLQTTRAATLECLGSDFIRTAHAKGASPARVLFRHALPAATVPILTVAALQLGHLLAGAVITETIFDWPGLGKLTYDAIMQRDYPTVQASVLLIALMYVALNTATDILAVVVDPSSGGERA